MNMIVAYDIAHPRRLQRIAKIMKDYGLRVQKSIFEVDVSEYQFREMKRRAELEMVVEEDGVKFFPICGRCSDTVLTLGRGVKIEEQGSFLIA
jgi:CRISPR-associated protein Cas2